MRCSYRGGFDCIFVFLTTFILCVLLADNKALYVISTTERQIYELVAKTSSEKNT